jgi:CHAD domain-containing protein
MELKKTDNPIDDAGAVKQVLSNLFYGWGYNFYRQENQLRADDLLIRSRLSDWLGESRAHLAKLEADYRRHYLPPPTREHPFPDAGAVSHAQTLQRVQRDIESIETAIRTASVPEMDRIHQRHRNEGETLEKLVAADSALVLQVKGLRDAIVAINDATAAIDQVPALLKTSQIDASWQQRKQILSALAESD